MRWLLIDADSLDPAGLVVTGARMVGQLDLRDLVVNPGADLRPGPLLATLFVAGFTGSVRRNA